MEAEFFSETFRSFTDGQLAVKEVALKIRTFLQDDPEATYSLVIGSDSHERQERHNIHSVQIVTAIVVHRKGFGGKYFWFKAEKSFIHSLREKIYAETMQSLDIARVFVPLLQVTLEGVRAKYSLEIHVDVGEYGETRAMIHEVVGMVTGYGFIARTKPYAFAASYVADKHT